MKAACIGWSAIETYRQGETRVYPPSIDQHGAGPALPAIAAFLGAGQLEPLAQQVQKRYARIVDLKDGRLTIDLKAECERHDSAPCWGVRTQKPAVRASAGVASGLESDSLLQENEDLLVSRAIIAEEPSGSQVSW
jgi:hypothetical protein